MKFNSVEELLNFTENIKGKTFEEIDSENLLKDKKSMKRYKGILGHVVESGFYKYPINSNPQADFDEIGVELKVTGYIKNKNGSLRAKERVSLSKINYFGIVNEEYEFSKLISKNKKILFIWYLFEPDKEIKDFKITHYQLYDMSQDEEIFKNDFELIKAKVKEGLAQELSEGATSYLGACTKARTSKDRTAQPFSQVMVKPRAFSLKNAYMTGVLNSSTSLPNISKFHTVEEYIHDKIKPFIGKSQLEIYKELTGKTYVEKVPKNISKSISDILIGKDKELPEKDDLFKKTSFIIKNLPIKPNGKPKERMSFRTLVLSEFRENWDDSYWKQYFEETTLIVICYREPYSNSKNGERILEGVKKISFNEEDLDSFKITYELVQKTIETVNTDYLPYPKTFEGQKLVIAPKGQKGDDAYNTMFEKDKTKIAFMIDTNCLHEKLSD